MRFRRTARTRSVVAAAAILALLAVAAWAGWSLLTPRRDVITVTAQFDNAAGLYPDNKVTSLGMPIGRVTKITPKAGYVEVEFTVDRNVPIPADAQAVTISTSILTDRQIELTPAYRGGPTLADHDTIGLTHTKTPVEFTQVLDVLNKVSSSLKGDGHGGGAVADVIDNSAAILDGNGEHIKTALDELSKALRLSANGGAQTREQITAIATNIAALFTAAADNDTTLREFGSTVHQLSQILANENLGSGTTGRLLNSVIQQAGEILAANRDHLKKAISSGNTVLKTTVDHQRDLAEVLDVAPLTLDNIYNAIDRDNGAIRTRIMTDRALFDTQGVKEVCNLMGLRQLGCSTGTLQDFGPDFGLTSVLDGMAAMGQK